MQVRSFAPCHSSRLHQSKHQANTTSSTAALVQQSFHCTDQTIHNGIQTIDSSRKLTHHGNTVAVDTCSGRNSVTGKMKCKGSLDTFLDPFLDPDSNKIPLASKTANTHLCTDLKHSVSSRISTTQLLAFFRTGYNFAFLFLCVCGGGRPSIHSHAKKLWNQGTQTNSQMESDQRVPTLPLHTSSPALKASRR